MIDDPAFYAAPVPAVVLMGLSKSGFGLAALVKEADRGLLGTPIGTALFGLLSPAAVAGVVGALTLVFVAVRLVRPPRWLGVVPATVAGFTRFVAHAGGPPIGLYVLPLRLAPIAFAAVNLSKWLPYWWLGLIDGRNLATSLVLMPLAPLGVWLGVEVARRISRAWFERVFLAGMTATGVKLLWDGLGA